MIGLVVGAIANIVGARHRQIIGKEDNVIDAVPWPNVVMVAIARLRDRM